MASATAAKPGTDEETAEAAPKKSKKKLVIIGVVLLLVAGGGYKFFGPKGPTPPPKPGLVLAIDPVTLNLADGHYLKLGIALQETTTPSADISGSQALDIAIAVISNQPTTALLSAEARETLKKELLKKIEKAYNEEVDQVMDVYFTSFVIQ